MLPGVLARQVRAARADGGDLIDGERLGVDGHAVEVRLHPADQLVHHDHGLVGARRAGGDVADVVEQGDARLGGGQQGHARLEGPLLVEHQRVGAAAVAEGGQAVVPGQIGGGLLHGHRLGIAVEHVRRARVHRTLGDPVDIWSPGLRELGDDEAAEHLGVGEHQATGPGGGGGSPLQQGAGVDHGDAELGAAHEPGRRVLAVHERRRRHGVDGPAVGGAADRRHLVEEIEIGGQLGHHDERLAGPAQHGRELRDRREVRGELVRVRHAHHEVDVGQLLLQRRQVLDVGQRHRAPVLGARAEQVEAVRAGAVVDGAGLQRQSAGPRTGRQRHAAGRRLQGVVDQTGRDPHARPIHLRARLLEQREGAFVLHLDAGLLKDFDRGGVQRGAPRLVEGGRAQPVLGHPGPP